MAERLSYWSRGIALGLALWAVAGWGAPSPAAAQQDDLDALCTAEASAGCRLAAAAVRLIHPRVGVALWGGSPVPGTASTLGMRLGSLPRFSTAGKITVLPMTLSPLADLDARQSTRALTAGLSGNATIGLLSGWSPLPTVGGLFSLDGVGRASWLLLPDGQGFHDGSVLGVAAGLRLGLLRESFTLPGVSITGMYGRSTSFAYGNPGGGDDGYIDGAVGNWKAAASATRRLGPVRLTAGGSYDRFTSDVALGYPGAPPGDVAADAHTDRWSAYGSLSWTFLIAHAVLEAGWQDAPVPDGLPDDVAVDPTGWWVAAMFRLSI